MSKQIRLRKLPFFDEPSRIQKLNDVFEIQDTIMPHQVAVATGCSFGDALAVLFLLYDRYIANAFLLVYHNKHNETPIMTLEVSGGPPALPLVCDLCELTVENEEELSYDFIFRINTQVKFWYEQ